MHMRMAGIIALAIGSIHAAQVTTEVVARNPSPSGADGDAWVVSRSLSGDGRYLAYSTRGVQDDFELRMHLVDLTNGTARRIRAGGEDPDQCHLSADGRWLAVHVSTGLYLIETASGASRRIAAGRDARLSSDGRWLAYLEDDSTDPMVRIHDRLSGTSTPVIGGGLTRLLTMSGNGQVLVCEASGVDYHAINRTTGVVTFIADNGSSANPNGIGIDHSGRSIAYTQGVTGESSRAYVLDLQTGVRARADGLSAASPHHAWVGIDALSADGEYVALASYDPLVAGDHNGLMDTYVCRWRTGEITRRSLKSDGSEGAEDAQCPLIAAYDSRIVLFEAEEFVRFSNPDGSVDPDWPAASLVLSDYAWRPFSAKINFQPAGSPKPARHQVDSGSVFAARGGGWSFGWRRDNARASRDRNHVRSPDQRWDTHLRMQDASSPSAVWEIAVPDGWYSVRIVAGDPRYFDGRMRIGAEGVLAIDFTPTSAQPWQDRTVLTRVRDGRLTLHALAGAAMNKLCFVEISSATPPGATSLAEFNVDFQPAAAQRVNGYAPDSGQTLARRDNGWTYGWTTANATTFEANSTRSPDQRFDTGIALPGGARWELQLPSGWWAVSIACGDAADASGRYRVNAEGQLMVDGSPTTDRRFVEGDGEVEVRDGRMTIEAGVGAEDVKLDFIDLLRVPMSPG